MTRTVIVALVGASLALTASCGTESKCDVPTCSGEDDAGIGADTGGPGREDGGNNNNPDGGPQDGGIPDAGEPLPRCDQFDEQFAQKYSPYALAPAVGAWQWVDGQQVAVDVGFDVEAELMAYSPDFKSIDLWSTAAGGITVRWQQTLSTFGEHEVIRVTRTKDWLILRSKNNHFFALHTSIGGELEGPLEALPDDGPVLRPLEFCSMTPSAGCEPTAVAVEGKRGSETVVVKAGWSGAMEKNDTSSVWNIWNNGRIQRGTCGGPAEAQVIEVMALLFYRK